MNHDQILGGLLGCGVVASIALGIIAMRLRDVAKALQGFTVERDDVVPDFNPFAGQKEAADIVAAAREEARVGKMPQIGIRK